MAALLCDNGHTVPDPDALNCTLCGARVRMRVNTTATQSLVTAPATVHPQPLALIVSGVATACLAGLIFAVAEGSGLGAFLAVVLGTVATTLWLTGVVAMGVRIGMARTQ